MTKNKEVSSEAQYGQREHPLVAAAKEELRKFLAGAKEGTPQFVAFTDMIDLKKAEITWKDACQTVAAVQADANATPLQKVQAASHLRICEGSMVQADENINNHVKFVQGYLPHMNELVIKERRLKAAYMKIGEENIEEKILGDMVGLTHEAVMQPAPAPNAQPPTQER